MSKFFTNKENIFENDGIIKIAGEDVNHMKNVLRLIAGDELTVCDGCGVDYICHIDKIYKNEIILNINSKTTCHTEPPYKAVLFQGIAKGERMDQLIQKCVELGVYKIVPVICGRTVVKFNNDKDKESKKARWQKIAVEAAKQCNRGIVPEIGEITEFSEAIKLADADLKFIPYEEEKDITLKNILTDVNQNIFQVKDIEFIIGPEGGFEKHEVDFANSNGFKTVTLGNRILRTETAGPAVLAILGHELERIQK